MTELEQENLDPVEKVETPPEASPDEGTSEEQVEEQPRDEQGRFAPREEMILGRFKSYEELEKAYSELDSEFGRRNQEWGELRKEMAELRSALPQQAPQQIPVNQETLDWFDERVSENAYAAAEWARQNDPSGVYYDRALEAWYAENPRQASAYERQLERFELMRHIQAQQQPVQDMVVQQQMGAALAEFVRDEPEAVSFANAMYEVAAERTELLAALQYDQSPEMQKKVFRNLYDIAKTRQASTVASQAGQVLAQQAAETQAARDQAFVATGGSVQEPEVKTPEQRWLEEVFDPAASRYYGE